MYAAVPFVPACAEAKPEAAGEEEPLRSPMPSRKVCLAQEPQARVEDEGESSDPGSRETANLSPCPPYATSPHNRRVESPAVRSASASSGSPNDVKVMRGQYPSPEARSEWRKNMVRHCSTPELWPHANTPELWPTPECNQPAQHLNGSSVAPLPLPEEPEDRDRQWVWGELGDAEPTVLPPGWQEAPKDDACYPPQWPVQNHSEHFAAPPPWAENGDYMFVDDEFGFGDEMVYDGLRRGPDGRWVRAVTRRRKPRRAFMSPTIDERSMMGRTSKLSWLGRIVGLAREPLSSRMMQRDLRECASMPGLVTAVVEEIAPHFSLLMNDPVGNYFCQALIDVACPQDLAVLLRSIVGSLGDIALTRHGSYAVQQLIRVTIDRAPDQTSVLTQALENAVVRLTKDVHGHHVIKCCLDTLTHEASGFILQKMRGSLHTVAANHQGSKILQECFKRHLDENLVTLAEEIAKHACSHSKDPFGNYVVQSVLTECQGTRAQELIAEAITQQLVPLSQQKYSSNVVELCFKVVDHHWRAHMIQALLDDPEGLRSMVQDSFGNYVVQSILATARKTPQLDRVVSALEPAISGAMASMPDTPAARSVRRALRTSAPTPERRTAESGAKTAPGASSTLVGMLTPANVGATADAIVASAREPTELAQELYRFACARESDVHLLVQLLEVLLVLWTDAPSVLAHVVHECKHRLAADPERAGHGHCLLIAELFSRDLVSLATVREVFMQLVFEAPSDHALHLGCHLLLASGPALDRYEVGSEMVDLVLKRLKQLKGGTYLVGGRFSFAEVAELRSDSRAKDNTRLRKQAKEPEKEGKATKADERKALRDKHTQRPHKEPIWEGSENQRKEAKPKLNAAVMKHLASADKDRIKERQRASTNRALAGQGANVNENLAKDVGELQEEGADVKISNTQNTLLNDVGKEASDFPTKAPQKILQPAARPRGVQELEFATFSMEKWQRGQKGQDRPQSARSRSKASLGVTKFQ